ncbi:hypothetical protein Fmac_016519 [Flemingia macrophylla]|uniref:Non-haem dioxygenase N-terminal domain-containing protein n=1 Tax=Flemingia macrophylla TaxID=520843 RepID=A0ABD1MHK6_9FABA
MDPQLTDNVPRYGVDLPEVLLFAPIESTHALFCLLTLGSKETQRKQDRHGGKHCSGGFPETLTRGRGEEKLRDACERYGCFRIINHLVPPTLMADMKLVAKHLHDLPKDIKMLNKYAILPDNNGYVPLSVTSPIYESLAIYDMHASPHDEVQDFFSQLDVSPHDLFIHSAILS